MPVESRTKAPCAKPRPAGRTKPASSRTDHAPARPAPIQRILCPIDFSDHSREAVDHALALARWCGAEITAVFVLPIAPAGRPASANAGTEPGVRGAIAEDLARFVRAGRTPEVRVWMSLQTGDVAEAILAEAARIPADLIVMGTHGRSGVDRWMLGSVTDEVLRRASCPVLTVSSAPPARAAARGHGPGILCALDLSEGSARTADFAFTLAGLTRAPVTLLHVMESGARGGGRAADGVAHRLGEIAGAHRMPAQAVEEVVAAGPPRRAILRAAAKSGAGLIVIGLRDPVGPRACLGSTAEHVVRHARVPVLTVRGPVPPRA